MPDDVFTPDVDTLKWVCAGLTAILRAERGRSDLLPRGSDRIASRARLEAISGLLLDYSTIGRMVEGGNWPPRESNAGEVGERTEDKGGREVFGE